MSNIAKSDIAKITDPFDRFVAFIVEREVIRLKREAGEPWPWTDDSILQDYRFTNIHREHDRVSLHYQKTVRNVIKDSAVLPATVLYRWFNRPETCEHFFRISYGNQTPFEHYLDTNDINQLLVALRGVQTPHVTGAFIIQGKAGYSKGEGVLRYFHDWCKKPWLATFMSWRDTKPPTLERMFSWLQSDGLGSFMTAQLVADLKYLPFMLKVPDWWTWAAPGPGSMRGLNFLNGRVMDHPWYKNEWLSCLTQLQVKVTPVLEQRGISRLHAQDLQNCLCEFSKYEKTRLGTGRPRQIFRHA